MYKRAANGWMKHIDFILLDVLCLHAAFVLAYWIRLGVASPYADSEYAGMSIVITVVDFCVAIVFNTMHHVLKRGWYQEMVATLKHVAMVFAVITVYLFSSKSGILYSRILLFLMVGFHTVFGYAVRILWKQYFIPKRRTTQECSVLVVAAEDEAAAIVETLTSENTGAWRVAGVVLLQRDARGEKIGGVDVVASVENAAEYICREWVDEVFLSCKGNHQNLEPLINACYEMGVAVHENLEIRSTQYSRRFVEKIGDYTVLTTAMNAATPLQVLLKRLLDIAGGAVGCLCALLVLLIVGPKIKKASPGPILFAQERIGKNGRRFKFYKIRSMYLDAEERKKSLMDQNRVSDGMMFKMDFDPRIIGNEILPDGTHRTGIGEWIRKTSLDEFPQFWNVLKGDMSLVGTRPPTVDEWEKYELHHRARLAMKPGITGLWQVSGRSNITDFEEVVKLDTEYIMNWSMGLDMRILAKTVISILKHDGAM